MSKILKLINSENEDDNQIAKVIIKQKPQLKKDVIAVGKYLFIRNKKIVNYKYTAYWPVTKSFLSLKRLGNLESLAFYGLFDDDLRRTVIMARDHLHDKTPTNYYYRKAIEALKRLKKDQY